MFTRLKFLSRGILAATFLLVLAPAQTASPAPANVDIDRTKTLILDMDSGRDLTPDVWNPFLEPGEREKINALMAARNVFYSA